MRTCVHVTDLVVSEGHAAAHTLLQPHVSKVTAPLAAGLGDQLSGAEEPEETLLKVVGAADATAVELFRERSAPIRVTAVTPRCSETEGDASPWS